MPQDTAPASRLLSSWAGPRPEGGTKVIRKDDALLVVIDVQEKLLPHIAEHERVTAQIQKLIDGFLIAGAPALATEQYRKGLGPTHPALIDSLTRNHPESFAPIEKMTFGCCAHPPFLEAIERLGRSQVVLSGIEAHVCVLQTALQLRALGRETYIVADAISSRDPRNVEIALRRMEQEGVRWTSVEMSVFEMLHESGTPAFKAWSQRIR
ncbi:MAG: hydrolase [Candidatus Eisenbacteria bacterium]|nr:hydrolase [Candidatus Eisenbacteria bacterium]